MTQGRNQYEETTRVAVYHPRGDDECFRGYALSVLVSGSLPENHPCSEHLVKGADHRVQMSPASIINEIEASGLFSLNDSQQTKGMINYQFSGARLPRVRSLMRNLREAGK